MVVGDHVMCLLSRATFNSEIQAMFCVFVVVANSV